MAGAAVRGRWSALRTFSALGVLAAAVLAVNVNVLVARWYTRWDLTSDALYTLSEPTLNIVRTLESPIDVVVLLSRSDPLLSHVRHLLSAYGAETRKLQLRFLDPDQHPAEFLAIQQKYGVLAGKADDGRVVTDASIIIAAGERHWFITPNELMRFDSESGEVRPQLEQAFTEGLLNVQQTAKATVCFTRGHQELGLHDAGPEGLAELRSRIEKSNYLVEERDLPAVGKGAAFEGCRLIIVAGPRLPFGPADAAQLSDAIRAGASALLLLGPLLGEGGALQPTGLESTVALAEARLGNDIVVERDSSARLPRGVGEVFFAVPRRHEVTSALLKGGDKVQFRVLMSEAQSVLAEGAAASALLVSSDDAVRLDNLRNVLDGSIERTIDNAVPSRQTLAIARELARPPGAAFAPRMVVVGSANVAWGRNFRDSGLYGDRVFTESAISWLASRPALASIPQKPSREVGLALTEESMGEVLRYVIVYMPGTAALVGLFVLLRRRAFEKRSRRDAEARKGNDEART